MEPVSVALGIIAVCAVVVICLAVWRVAVSMYDYVGELELMLKVCRDQFITYGDLHRAKDTEESDAKAEVNYSLASDITVLLEDY